MESDKTFLAQLMQAWSKLILNQFVIVDSVDDKASASQC